MDYCFICSEDYNNTTHKKVECMYCQYPACRTCCQTYILDRESNVCMNADKDASGNHICQKQWTRQFIVQSFPDAWIKTKWRNMNEKIGFEREKALLPATMTIIAQRKEDEQINLQIQEINNQITLLYNARHKLERNLSTHYSKKDTNENKHFRGRACPDEDCRGFLSTQWKCGLCDMWTCPDCNQIKGLNRDAPHECNPDDVATATLLNQDTKPCPSCRTPIHKIAGCDQMWCTLCHTAFSWRTGAIQTRVHNPHFFEWQRQNNDGDPVRNFADVQCDRDLGDSRVLMSVKRFLRNAYLKIFADEFKPRICIVKQQDRKLETIIRGTIHLNHIQANRFRTDQVVNNQDIRLAYLEKSIDEKKFKSDIIRRDKAYDKKQDIFNVLQLQVQAITDIIYRFENNLVSTNSDSFSQEEFLNHVENLFNTYLQEVQNITDYANALLQKHATTYSCKKYVIDYHRNDQRNNNVLF